jgi:site-specific DNA-methyltransferase (adenine-specific)
MVAKRPRRGDWETPDWLFERMHEEFNFTVDASADGTNCKLSRYWDKFVNGLSYDWSSERVWCNPPYGKFIGSWTEKANQSKGLVVMLLPVRSETTWWCRDVLEASEIRFIRGRVHFKLDGGTNPHPKGCRPVYSSAIVVFRPGDRGAPALSSFPTPYIEKHEAKGRSFL